MPGSPEGEQPIDFLPPERKRYRRETLTDYSAMLRYIRADKSTPAFLQDIRDNKTHLLAYFNEIFEDRENPIHDEPYGMKMLKTKYSIVRYLNTMLQLHVFDMDPYYEDHDPTNTHESLIEIDSRWMRGVAKEWLQKHPHSEPAKDITLLGAEAAPLQRHRFLQEMWPTFVPLLTGQAEKNQNRPNAAKIPGR